MTATSQCETCLVFVPTPMTLLLARCTPGGAVTLVYS